MHLHHTYDCHRLGKVYVTENVLHVTIILYYYNLFIL